MDSVVHSALEEICLGAAGGISLPNLWPNLQTSLAAVGLPLCPNVKAALWSNFLSIPGLLFLRDHGGECQFYHSQHRLIQSVEKCEQINLKIIASKSLRNNFLGVYDVDISVSDSSITTKTPQPRVPSSSNKRKKPTLRNVLKRLATARHNGITQSELVKEYGSKANTMFYVLKKLETQGLIVRQSTLVKTKKACSDGETKSSSNTITNMLYLYRYAKHLGCQQRLEIIRGHKRIVDNCDDRDITVANAVDTSKEVGEENVQVKDFLPAMKAICDKLKQADGKICVMSDIKRLLGYRGDRTWTRIYSRLVDAGVVKCFPMKVNGEVVACLQLLKNFTPTYWRKGNVELDVEQPKSRRRGEITDRLVELPIENQMFDMVDAEGTKGLTITEMCKRLGVCNKQYYSRIHDMCSKFGLHLRAERINRSVVCRIWTLRNFNSETSNILKCSSAKDLCEITECDPRPLVWDANNNFSPLTQDVDASLEDVVKSADETGIEPEALCCSTANVEDKMILHPLSTLQNSPSEASMEVSNKELKSEAVTSLDGTQPKISPAVSQPSKWQSHQMYHCLNLPREMRILEMLEEEKLLLKPELRRRLEDLENLGKERKAMIGRKTLDRILNKLHQEGRCRFIAVNVPLKSNYFCHSIANVVVHPSISDMSDELFEQICERQSSFEFQKRNISSSRLDNGALVPVLDSVERIPVNVQVDNHAKQAEARRANGYVLAKMVRTKLLHIFLWGYLSPSPGWDDLFSAEKKGHDLKNHQGTSKLFELDAAIKAMPLDIFLQVVGSIQMFENLIEKCRNGLCLSDLQEQEYRCLVNTRAKGCLSQLINILQRLKLVRLVRASCSDDEEKVQDATLFYALDLKPYIEEPVSTVASSSGFIFPDLCPSIRHDFVLSTRRTVEEYWSTLEYCYAASDSKAALHAFPGSAVHEIFSSRSWSYRVMTTNQRAELLKYVVNDEPLQILPFNECQMIAKDLNLTVEQVLRFFHDKRQQHLARLDGDLCTVADVIEPLKSKCSSSRKRKRSLEGKSLNDVNCAMKGGHLGKQSFSHISVTTDQLTERQNSFLKTLGDYEIGLQQDLGDEILITGGRDSNEDEHGITQNSTPLRLKPERKRRFLWTEEYDRQLVIEYAKHRAFLGAQFTVTDWGSLTNLPAPPEACKRRMALLNSNLQIRHAVLRLCNLLSDRYAKNLEKFQNTLVNSVNSRPLTREPISQEHCDKNIATLFEHNEELESEEPWDNFEESNVKMALDDVLRLKGMANLNSTEVHSYEWFCGQDPHGTESVPSALLSLEDEIPGPRSKLSARRSRSRRIVRKYNKLFNEETSIRKGVYQSVSVSNAVELFKLVCLTSSLAPQASTLLAETLRQYSQDDSITALGYLRDHKILIGGDGTTQLALSQNFLNSISLSPFPTTTGRRALQFARWLAEREKDLMEGEIYLPPNLHCGDIFHLCILISQAEYSIIPRLPEEGIGEANLGNSKCQSDCSGLSGCDKSKRLRVSTFGKGEIISRREKGFPGIRLALSRARVPRITTLDMLTYTNGDGVSLFAENGLNRSSSLRIKIPSSFPNECTSAKVRADDLDFNHGCKSLWEAMTCYADYLIFSFYHEQSSFVHPELFRSICSAIRKSSDQGLSKNEFSKVLNLSGQEELQIVIDVLEAFGRAFKVSAYDSFHVVDALHRSKYFLTSTPEAVQIQETFPVDCKGECDHEHRIFYVANSEDDSLSPQDEMKIDSEDFHQITVLNHPKECTELSSDIQNLPHSSPAEVEDYTPSELLSARVKSRVKAFELNSCDHHLSRPILPWINGDGTINELVYKGLVRRVLGIVMQNPGILEDEIIKHMRALNPQSCRTLLQTLILDNHIIVRKMQQTSVEPPILLGSILGSCTQKSKIIIREHFFANPMSTALL